ncbi:MAG: lamin tail domain-containing protein [Acidimicrobiia bacterium]
MTGDVLEVEDGDTFVLGTVGREITIRLLGVNAPERDECFHDKAAAGLASYLDNRAVGVEDHGEDQFGRTLGYVWAGDTLVNLALVANGLAIATTPGDTDTWGPSLLVAEEAAYRARIGLWDQTACSGHATTDIDLSIDTAGHNPPGADDQVLDLEQVTIINNGDEAVDISGWVLRDESSAHRFRFPGGSVIGPGAAIQVTSDDPGWEPGGTPVWNNTGDMALLLTPDGGVTARQRYRP